MALLHLFIALVIQGSFTTYANNDTDDTIYSQENLLVVPEIDDEVAKEYHVTDNDWLDFLLVPDAPLYPTGAAAMMEQATNSDKPVEVQLEEIKDIAEKITHAIKSEMANLLTYALTVTEQSENTTDPESSREKRSVESPLGCSQLVTRLLKHIKSTNEYQNIAIEKMMTAQEIADKYGIEYRPDTEILSDLAFAANENAKEMSSLLEDASKMRNATKKVNVQDPVKAEKPSEYDTFYVYLDQHPENHESAQSVPKSSLNHHHCPNSHPNHDHHHHHHHPCETQIPSPVQNYYSPPTTDKPNFYDTIDYYSPYCSIPMSPVISFEEIEAEPELVGEEYEETITSKVLVDRGDDPGSATVNHVMTYTVSEKSHFKKPEIERLPEQIQYCFFLI